MLEAEEPYLLNVPRSVVTSTRTHTNTDYTNITTNSASKRL